MYCSVSDHTWSTPELSSMNLRSGSVNLIEFDCWKLLSLAPGWKLLKNTKHMIQIIDGIQLKVKCWNQDFLV